MTITEKKNFCYFLGRCDKRETINVDPCWTKKEKREKGGGERYRDKYRQKIKTKAD